MKTLGLCHLEDRGQQSAPCPAVGLLAPEENGCGNLSRADEEKDLRHSIQTPSVDDSTEQQTTGINGFVGLMKTHNGLCNGVNNFMKRGTNIIFESPLTKPDDVKTPLSLNVPNCSLSPKQELSPSNFKPSPVTSPMSSPTSPPPGCARNQKLSKRPSLESLVARLHHRADDFKKNADENNKEEVCSSTSHSEGIRKESSLIEGDDINKETEKTVLPERLPCNDNGSDCQAGFTCGKSENKLQDECVQDLCESRTRVNIKLKSVSDNSIESSCNKEISICHSSLDDAESSSWKDNEVCEVKCNVDNGVELHSTLDHCSTVAQDKTSVLTVDKEECVKSDVLACNLNFHKLSCHAPECNILSHLNKIKTQNAVEVNSIEKTLAKSLIIPHKDSIVLSKKSESSVEEKKQCVDRTKLCVVGKEGKTVAEVSDKVTVVETSKSEDLRDKPVITSDTITCNNIEKVSLYATNINCTNKSDKNCITNSYSSSSSDNNSYTANLEKLSETNILNDKFLQSEELVPQNFENNVDKNCRTEERLTNYFCDKAEEEKETSTENSNTATPRRKLAHSNSDTPMFSTTSSSDASQNEMMLKISDAVAGLFSSTDEGKASESNKLEEAIEGEEENLNKSLLSPNKENDTTVVEREINFSSAFKILALGEEESQCAAESFPSTIKSNKICGVTDKHIIPPPDKERVLSEYVAQKACSSSSTIVKDENEVPNSSNLVVVKGEATSSSILVTDENEATRLSTAVTDENKATALPSQNNFCMGLNLDIVSKNIVEENKKKSDHPSLKLLKENLTFLPEKFIENGVCRTENKSLEISADKNIAVDSGKLLDDKCVMKPKECSSDDLLNTENTCNVNETCLSIDNPSLIVNTHCETEQCCSRNIDIFEGTSKDTQPSLVNKLYNDLKTENKNGMVDAVSSIQCEVDLKTEKDEDLDLPLSHKKDGILVNKKANSNEIETTAYKVEKNIENIEKESNEIFDIICTPFSTPNSIVAKSSADCQELKEKKLMGNKVSGFVSIKNEDEKKSANSNEDKKFKDVKCVKLLKEQESVSNFVSEDEPITNEIWDENLSSLRSSNAEGEVAKIHLSKEKDSDECATVIYDTTIQNLKSRDCGEENFKENEPEMCQSNIDDKRQTLPSCETKDEQPNDVHQFNSSVNTKERKSANLVCYTNFEQEEVKPKDISSNRNFVRDSDLLHKVSNIVDGNLKSLKELCQSHLHNLEEKTSSSQCHDLGEETGSSQCVASEQEVCSSQLLNSKEEVCPSQYVNAEEEKCPSQCVDAEKKMHLSKCVIAEKDNCPPHCLNAEEERGSSLCVDAVEDMCPSKCVIAEEEVCPSQCVNAEEEVCPSQCVIAKKDKCPSQCVKAEEEMCPSLCVIAGEDKCPSQCVNEEEDKCPSQCVNAEEEMCPSECVIAEEDKCPLQCVNAEEDKCPSEYVNSEEEMCPSQCVIAEEDKCPSQCVNAEEDMCPSECVIAEEEMCPSECVIAEEDKCPSQCVNAEEDKCPSQCVNSEEEMCPSQCAIVEEDKCPSHCVVAEEEVCQPQCLIAEEELSQPQCVIAEGKLCPPQCVNAEEEVPSLCVIAKEDKCPSQCVKAEDEMCPSQCVNAEEDKCPSQYVNSEEEMCPSQCVIAEEDKCPSHCVVAEEEVPSLCVIAEGDKCSPKCVKAEKDMCPSQYVNAEKEICIPQYVNAEDKCPSQCVNAKEEVCPSQCVNAEEEKCPPQCVNAEEEICESQCVISEEDKCPPQGLKVEEEVCPPRCVNAMEEICPSQCVIGEKEECPPQCLKAEEEVCPPECVIAEEELCPPQCVNEEEVICPPQCIIAEIDKCPPKCLNAEKEMCPSQYVNAEKEICTPQYFNAEDKCPSQCVNAKEEVCPSQCVNTEEENCPPQCVNADEEICESQCVISEEDKCPPQGLKVEEEVCPPRCVNAMEEICPSQCVIGEEDKCPPQCLKAEAEKEVCPPACVIAEEEVCPPQCANEEEVICPSQCLNVIADNGSPVEDSPLHNKYIISKCEFVNFLKRERILETGKCVLCQTYIHDDLTTHASLEHSCISYIPIYLTQAYMHHMRERLTNVSYSFSDSLYGNPFYICETCGILIKSTESVRLHLNIHQDIYMVRSSSNPCSCDKKSYSYPHHKWKSLLLESRHKCQLCRHIFACVNGLVNHIKVVHYSNSSCKKCKIYVDNENVQCLLEHNVYHTNNEPESILKIILDKNCIETRDQTFYSWNALDNHLNYLDGKIYRLNMCSDVRDSKNDRGYLSLPIKVDPIDATIPESTALLPGPEMDTYLNSKLGHKVNDKDLDEYASKEFDLPVQLLLHKKFAKKRRKARAVKIANEHEASPILRNVKLQNASFQANGKCKFGDKNYRAHLSSLTKRRSPRQASAKASQSIKEEQIVKEMENSFEDITLPSRTRSGMKVKDLISEREKALPSTPKPPTEVTGEWVNYHTYVCCSCGSAFLDLADIMDHKWEAHPGVWCAHTMIQGQEMVPKLFYQQYQPAHSVSKLLMNPSQRKNKKEGKQSPFICTRCKSNFVNGEAFHSHVIECGGLNQMVTSKKKNKNKKGYRFRRRKGQGIPNRRYPNNNNTSAAPTPHKNTSERGSGTSTPSKESAQQNGSLTSSSVVKRRLELAVGSIENAELKSKLLAILSDSAQRKKGNPPPPKKKSIKMKLRKKILEKRSRLTRQSEASGAELKESKVKDNSDPTKLNKVDRRKKESRTIVPVTSESKPATLVKQELSIDSKPSSTFKQGLNSNFEPSLSIKKASVDSKHSLKVRRALSTDCKATLTAPNSGSKQSLMLKRNRSTDSKASLTIKPAPKTDTKSAAKVKRTFSTDSKLNPKLKHPTSSDTKPLLKMKRSLSTDSKPAAIVKRTLSVDSKKSVNVKELPNIDLKSHLMESVHSKLDSKSPHIFKHGKLKDKNSDISSTTSTNANEKLCKIRAYKKKNLAKTSKNCEESVTELSLEPSLKDTEGSGSETTGGSSCKTKLKYVAEKKLQKQNSKEVTSKCSSEAKNLEIPKNASKFFGRLGNKFKSNVSGKLQRKTSKVKNVDNLIVNPSIPILSPASCLTPNMSNLVKDSVIPTPEVNSLKPDRPKWQSRLHSKRKSLSPALHVCEEKEEYDETHDPEFKGNFKQDNFVGRIGLRKRRVRQALRYSLRLSGKENVMEEVTIKGVNNIQENIEGDQEKSTKMPVKLSEPKSRSLLNLSEDDDDEDEIIIRPRKCRKYNIDDDDLSEENLAILSDDEPLVSLVQKKKEKKVNFPKSSERDGYPSKNILINPLENKIVNEKLKRKRKLQLPNMKSHRKRVQKLYHIAQKNISHLKLSCQNTDSESSGFEGFSTGQKKRKANKSLLNHLVLDKIKTVMSTTKMKESKVIVGGGATKMKESKVIVGGGATKMKESKVIVGGGATKMKESKVIVGGGEATKMKESKVIVGGGGATKMKESKVIVGGGGGATKMKESKVIVGGGGATKMKESKVIVGGGGATKMKESKVIGGGGGATKVKQTKSKILTKPLLSQASRFQVGKLNTSTEIHGGEMQMLQKPTKRKYVRKLKDAAEISKEPAGSKVKPADYALLSKGKQELLLTTAVEGNKEGNELLKNEGACLIELKENKVDTLHPTENKNACIEVEKENNKSGISKRKLGKKSCSSKKKMKVNDSSAKLEVKTKKEFSSAEEINKTISSVIDSNMKSIRDRDLESAKNHDLESAKNHDLENAKNSDLESSKTKLVKPKRKYTFKKRLPKDELEMVPKIKSKKELKEVRVLSYKSLNTSDPLIPVQDCELSDLNMDKVKSSVESITDSTVEDSPSGIKKKRAYKKRVRVELDENSPNVASQNKIKRKYKRKAVSLMDQSNESELNSENAPQEEYISYLCTDCGLSFDSLLSREDHRQDCRNIAFEMSLMAEDYLYECPHCQLTFALKGTQRKHTISCRASRSKKNTQRRRSRQIGAISKKRLAAVNASNDDLETVSADPLENVSLGTTAMSDTIPSGFPKCIKKEMEPQIYVLSSRLMSLCQQHSEIEEVCSILFSHKLCTNDLRSLITTSVTMQGSTVIQIKHGGSQLGSTNQNSNYQILQALLRQPPCLNLPKIFEDSHDKMKGKLSQFDNCISVNNEQSSSQFSLKESETANIILSDARSELLKALSSVEDLLKEASDLETSFKKQQMLLTMKETFQAGTTGS